MSPLPWQAMLKLKRLSTPTVYNGLESLTNKDRLGLAFNREETRDFMEEMGPMVGHAVTVVIEPSNPSHKSENPGAWVAYRKYVASVDGPKIVVVQDLDKPAVTGAFWGEVNSNIHLALGCVGTITDGGIRDIDEMREAGFKALAKRPCVGHAYSHPVRWGCEVDVFGTKVQPGDLLHADKHGFLVIPEEDQPGILDASTFLDNNECETTIAAAKNARGKDIETVLEEINDAARRFKEASKERFG